MARRVWLDSRSASSARLRWVISTTAAPTPTAGPSRERMG